ncbi:MAG: aminotransferase class V-fold PLP-dependent enzyme [Chloroflexota bacterium]
MKQALAPHSDFLGLDGITHLYTAAECPMLAAGAAALQDYARHKSRAEVGRAHHLAVVRDCKAALGRLLGVAAEEIAFVASASDGINQVAGAIGLAPGENVVVNDLEFPSVALPWLRLRRQGTEVRVVRHQRWDIPTEALLAAVDGHTRLVALSHVSFVNGLRHDVEAIGRALRETRTLLLVDATQSLGVLPVPAAAADFVVSSTYKWLLGTHGLGVLYWNRQRRPELVDVEPGALGWYSIADTFEPLREQRYTLKPDAGRFETGYVSFPAIYALNASVPYLLNAGSERIAAHALALGAQMIDGLASLRLEVMTPTAAERRGASVSFAHPEATEIGRALAERGVHLWAGEGRVRASTHLFNDGDDVARYLDVLAEVLHGRGGRAGGPATRSGTVVRS